MPKKEKIQPLQVYQFLPGTNCKECGNETCLAFAFELIAREKVVTDCPYLKTDEFREGFEFLKNYFGEAMEVAKTGLLIEKERCNGCGDCVIVCNKALNTVMYSGMIMKREDVPPVLDIVDGILEVVKWDSCKRCMEPPDYCRVCEEKCTFGALELVR